MEFWKSEKIEAIDIETYSIVYKLSDFWLKLPAYKKSFGLLDVDDCNLAHFKFSTSIQCIEFCISDNWN